MGRMFKPGITNGMTTGASCIGERRWVGWDQGQRIHVCSLVSGHPGCQFVT